MLEAIPSGCWNRCHAQAVSHDEPGIVSRAPLVITGGPAVGKTSTGRQLAESRSRGGFIDVDDVRHLVVSGHQPPWAGEEGRAQQRLGVENACSLAARLYAAGFEVVVVDVLVPRTAQLYRLRLPGCVIVHLTITTEEALKRAATRKVWLTDDEFRRLHRTDQQDPPPSDHRADVTGLSPQEQFAAVQVAWSSAVTR